MTLSVIVNTCAQGDTARRIKSSGGVEHRHRAYLLNTWILPRLISDDLVDEIIVAGEWHEAPDDEWIYVEEPSEYYGAEDALAQRDAGFRASSGDMLIFQHDDHILGPEMTRLARKRGRDVISPSRWTRMRDPTGERLNDGWSDSYLHGHAICMSREAVEEVPWSEVPKEFVWDKLHTQLLLEAGYEPLLDSEMKIFDVEPGSEPWS